MTFRTDQDASRRASQPTHKRSRTRVRPGIEPLEGRELLAAAALAALPNITSPAGLGYQVPLDGSASGLTTQDYTAKSSNPDVKVTIAQGKFVTFNVTHTSSGTGDPSFSGSMTFQLFDDLTPISASSIESLVTSGFYTGKNFHRISSGFPDANGFIAQGGSVSGTGLDSPPAAGQPGGLPLTGFPFVDEYNLQLVNDGFGQLALANAGNDTNTSQFYITSSTPRFLDFNKTIFGQLVAGADIYKDVIGVTTASGSTTPASPITITTATLSNINPNGVVHVDTTGATQGESSTITVTASDPSTSTTATQAFTVSVGPTNATAPSDPNSNERPFIQTYPTSLTVGAGQKTVFKFTAVTAQPKTDILNYIVEDSVNSAGTGFNPVQNATATVNSNGVVTVTPNAGFSGTINLLIGVANQVDHTGGSGATSPGNYDTHNVTLTVNASSTPIGLAPVTVPFSTTATAGVATAVQLEGQSGNPGSGQGLTYSIVTQPTHGTITGLVASNGLLTYTPNPGFSGADTFTYNVTSTGSPTPNFVSNTSTATINVSLGNTNSVRLLGGVLVITPPARFDHKGNTISVADENGLIVTTVNGVVDATQPADSAVGEIIIYGTPLSDAITVSPTVSIPTEINGGRGGVNFITAGSEASRIHAWFGKNLVQGGTSVNDIVGQAGHLKVKKSSGTDSVFLSGINPVTHTHFGKPRHGGTPADPGAFYKFVGNKLVRTKKPVTIRISQG